VIIASGPQPADVLVVGEAPGVDEIKQQEPFVGRAGQELTRMLHESGFLRTECRITNVTSHRPLGNLISNFFPPKSKCTGGEQFVNGRWCKPEILEGLMQLKREIALTKPKIIIALGDTALWALTGESGITKWRGSLLWSDEYNAWIIPTFHPSGILRQWAWRYPAMHDLRRARKQLDNPVHEPSWSFLVRPDYESTIQVLDMLLARVRNERTRIACDIETRAGYTDCIGLSWSATEAICIPFFSQDSLESYWSLEEELQIVLKLRELLTHPGAAIIGQNFLYDVQFFARHWGFVCIPAMDTMIAHAVCFPGTPKSLDYLSSMYLDFHRYWKDERKEANDKEDDEQRWIYNCKDCVATWGVVDGLEATIAHFNLQKPFELEMRLFEPLLGMMLRGVKINKPLKNSLGMALLEERARLEKYFLEISKGVWDDVQLVKSKTAAPWYDSPTQQVKIFYRILGQQEVKGKNTKGASCDDDSLTVVARREVMLEPLIDHILGYRSLGVFNSTFVGAKLDWDGRMRCSYNPVGTETFRFNSKKDAFGFGTNLQNIPKGNEDD